MKAKFCDRMIQEFDQMAASVGTALKDNPTMDYTYYMANYRGALNTIIVQALLGAELRRKKNGTHVAVFKHRLPTYAQSMAIAERLQTYISKYEKEYLRSLKKKDPDDMSIPAAHGGIVYAPNMTNKVLGPKLVNSTDAFASYLIGPHDVMTIAAMGEDARRKANRDKGLVIGGIVIVGAAAAGVGGFMVHKHRKAKDEALYQEAIEEGDIPVLTDEVDIPSVDMDTE